MNAAMPPRSPDTASKLLKPLIWIKALGGCLGERGRKLWDDSPEWYQAGAIGVAIVFVLMIVALALLTVVGLTENAATAWGALLSACTALATFFIGRVAQELERRHQREEARVDLAMALHAEVSSNLQQQREALTDETINRKVKSELGKRRRRSTTTSDATGGGKAGATADTSNPIFAKAMEHYERIPHICISSLVSYYNLNDMLSQSTAAISEKALSGLMPAQKAQTLISYYELANRTDSMAMEALRALQIFVGEHKHILAPLQDPPFAFDAGRYPLLAAALLPEAEEEDEKGEEQNYSEGLQPIFPSPAEPGEGGIPTGRGETSPTLRQRSEGSDPS